MSNPNRTKEVRVCLSSYASSFSSLWLHISISLLSAVTVDAGLITHPALVWLRFNLWAITVFRR